MKKIIALASTLLATSVVSVGAAIASPANLTTSGQPAAWKIRETQSNSAPGSSVSQPSNVNQEKPVDVRDKEEVKAINAPIPAVSPVANQCTGDARFSTPPVVNNPHHVRNVVWRNMRAMCAN